MVSLKITKEQIKRAEKLYPFKSLRGSITKGKSNIYGALGEILVYDFFNSKGFKVDFNSTYDYDLIINGYKVDVKTKRGKTIPEPHHLASISSYNTKQECDVYMFTKILENYSTGYIVGYKSKSNFFKQAKFNKKGEADWNGWKFRADCYPHPLHSLHPVPLPHLTLKVRSHLPYSYLRLNLSLIDR